MAKLTSKSALDTMLHCFPRWMDIRKRTEKSIGGNLLKAYANNFDDIQEAIDDYVKDFFLVSYLGKESDYVDYLMVALVGNPGEITLESPALTITEEVDIFYDNLDSYALYKDSYILLHPDALGDLTNCIYAVKDSDGDTYKYSVKPDKRHIWNVFDEFAAFAGLVRYDGETNAQLTQRCFLAFTNFPNGSEDGLRKAIKNAVHNYDLVADDEIIFERPDLDNMSFIDYQYGTIYERLSAFNKDVFRQKEWDKSLWFHDFKELEYIPHVWDEPIPLTMNGVGYNDSLKVDYIANLKQKDYTSLEVTGYKKSEKAIKEYIRNNNIEASLTLILTKYADTIRSENIRYKILAENVASIDPNAIKINALTQVSGEGDYDLADLVESVENVTVINRGLLENNQQYRLEFTPKDTYSAMEIYNCVLRNNGNETNLLSERGDYIFRNDILVNKNVLAHITSLAGLDTYENLRSIRRGITLTGGSSSGKATLDITGMSNKVLAIKSSCQAVNITDNNVYVQGANGFELVSDTEYRDTEASSLGTITIELSCNSYSFELAPEADPLLQGSVIVTTVVNRQTKKRTLTSPQIISDSFGEMTDVKIIIQKNGQNPVSIQNIRASRYSIKTSIAVGTLVKNSMYTLLPAFTGTNTLTIEVESYTAIAPVIECIHIGNALTGAKYTVNFNTSGFTGETDLAINSSCNVALYKKSGADYILVNDDYTTKALYRNETSSNGYLLLNTENFISIIGSSPAIRERYNGGAKSYITLRPGESLDRITIDGEFLQVIESRTLSYYLCDNDSTNKEVYISNEPYFIVRSDFGDIKKTINKSDLNASADSFRVTGVPSVASVIFQINDTTELVSSSISRKFSGIYLRYKNAGEYIAYNDYSVLRAQTDNIEISNTFMPMTSLSTLHLYKIVDATNLTNATVFFRKPDGYDDWSLGVPELGITITAELDYENSMSYDLTISQLNGRYILHNEIPLEDYYPIDGELQNLSAFIIDPPDGFKINYETGYYEEEIYIENDGFNKLDYSNIISATVTINGSAVNNFSILKNEGIIVWNSDNYYGETAIVRYSYKKPVSMSYSDFEVLYNLIQYNAKAYELVGNLIFNNLEDGAENILNFEDAPDIVITKCSNGSFDALVSGNRVSVHQTKEDNKLAIKSGWIYDDALEYWHFNDKFIDTVDRFSNVELHNVTRMNGELLFHIRSKNYLPWSSMLGSNLFKLCDFDFTKKKFRNISKFNSYTACESYNGWILCNFDLTFSSAAYNGFGLHFESGDNGYAALDITPYLKKNYVYSLWTNGDLEVSLIKETLYHDMSFAKSLCIDQSNRDVFSRKDAFWYKIFKETPEKDTRYYLLVTGKSGTIDDLVAMPYTNLENMMSSHKKNIDKLGFEIPESAVTGKAYQLVFDYNHAEYDDLEYDHLDNFLRTSCTVEYGLTKVKEFSPEELRNKNARLQKDAFTFGSGGGTLATPAIYIKSAALAYRLYLKVNDFIFDEMKGFNIKVYTSSNANKNFSKIFEGSDINVAEIPLSKIKSYVKAEISGAEGQVVRSVEIYICYHEDTNISELVPLEKTSGEFISKVYDFGANGNFLWDFINYEATGNAVKFYLRAARKDKDSYIFSDWFEFKDTDNDNYKVRFDNYRLFQYKVEINNAETEVTIKSVNLKAVD